MEHPPVLFQLFALLAAAKIGDELFKRLGQPALAGEIIGGLVVGPAVLGWYEVRVETELFAQIGAVLLLFEVGVHTRVGDILRVGTTALAAAVMGVVLPFAAGFLLGDLFGLDMRGRLYIAASLTATSVAVSSGVLASLGALRSIAGRTILAAAVTDDVLGLLVVGVVAGLAAGQVDLPHIALVLSLAVAFIVIVVVAGTGLLRRQRSLLTIPRFAETPFLPGMIIMLGLAALAAQIGLAAIIGAFLAGSVVGESAERQALETETAPVAAFFTPFFFGFIGAQIDPSAFASISALGMVVALVVVAVVTKFAGVFLGALSGGWRRAVVIGWGMVPRGEVEIVIAGLALASGAFSHEIYAVVVAMVVVTMLLAPPLLKPLVRWAESSEPVVAV
ncbi:MAG: cation:proton antiporter [Chloroflexota bacterium]